MSGTGRVSVPLAEAGVELTCVDASEAMLAVLHRRLQHVGRAATVIRRDVSALGLPPTFRLAIMPFHSLAEITEPADRARALRAVFGALIPGGRFVCTLRNPRVRGREITGEVAEIGRFPRSGGAGTVVFRTRLSLDAGSGLVEGEQFLELLDASGHRIDERTVPVRFALIERQDFERLAAEAGFEREAMWGDYDRAPFDPDESPFMIWALRRPSRRNRIPRGPPGS